MERSLSRRRKQGGVVIILFTIGMVSLLGLAGLALDGGLAYVAKTRVQNAMDAAALAGAKALDLNAGNVPAATAEAQRVYTTYLGQLGSYANLPNPVVEFSTALAGPYAVAPASSPNLQFVRVRMNGVQASTYLLRAVPGAPDFFGVGGSAVAGRVAGAQPDNVLCNVVPIVVGEGSECTVAANPDDSPNCTFGYNVGDVRFIKPGAQSGDDPEQIGEGNFNLLALDGRGGSDLRDGLAGGGNCINSEDGALAEVDTEPGNTAGPTRQGINTRLGVYNGPVDSSAFPSDVITTEGISFATYSERLTAGNLDNPNGVPKRRLMSIVFSEIVEDVNGRSSIAVAGFGCYFLRSRATQNGGESQVHGEFVENKECNPGRTVVPQNPGSGGFTKIILFKDPDSTLT